LADELARLYVSKYPRDEDIPGTAMPEVTARETTRRQAACLLGWGGVAGRRAGG
jgi:hypothetical protein